MHACRSTLEDPTSLGFLCLLIASRTELRLVLGTLRSGEWQWVAVAALVLAGYYLAYAALYRACLEAVGVASDLGDTLQTVLGSLVVNFVVPSAGAALFIDGAARRGQSRARAAAGVLLAFGIDFVALSVPLIASLVFLAQRHKLQPAEVAGTLALALLIAGMGGLLMIGSWRPRWLRAVLTTAQRWLAGIARRVGRAPPLSPDWPERTAGEFIAVSETIRARPIRLVGPLGAGLAVHALGATSLGVLFVAFHQPIGPGSLLAGYSLGILAWIISPVPQGIGVVEGVLALVYASLGVPIAAATAIALAFRGLTFWLPMGVGFLLLRRLRSLRALATPGGGA